MNLSKKILSWYDNNKRTLPWRIDQNSKKNQYYRLLSEFMLQQTQVKTVIPYFLNFINKVPNLKSLSTTRGKKILKLWEGLGYYRRAKNLHKTSKILVKKNNGKIPKTFDEIIKLPGIGKYTANALLALIYNQPRIPMDGNVKRVFFRLFKQGCEISEKKIKKIFYTNRNGDLAEALMEFGAIICKPKKPLCGKCYLKKNCYYFINNKRNFVISSHYKKEKKYNIFCYLKKNKKIALKNNNLSFLNSFKIPEIKKTSSGKNSKRGWIYLCNYRNNISNIKMNINLFYKFTKTKPKKYKWYSTEKSSKEFIPSFTKKIIKKINKVYL